MKKNILQKIIFGIVCAILLSCTSQETLVDQDVYERLDAVRERKEAQLTDYMHKTKLAAESIGDDPVMAALFVEKNRLYREIEGKQSNVDLKARLAKVRSEIEDQYIDRYLMFHDILFIDNSGDIFYTLRKKSDYHKNIFAEDLAETLLSKSLREKPEGGFVDFENYQIAGEPSAFFVVPQQHDTAVGGWYVLQFAINKINEMFSLEEDLGKTGEVFLVNRERAMLTDSKFYAQSTVLSKHLSKENINAKFAEGEGHKVVTDYRGSEALTSFKVVKVLGSEWLLIAKIDKNEILTENFLRDSNQHMLQLEKHLLTNQHIESRKEPEIRRDIEVDMDEFRRVDNSGKGIYTHGVRSCSAVLMSYPGKFSYMAHISANDIIYGGDKTDLLGIIKKRIDDFEIPRAEKNNLQIYIISPHPQYKKNIVENLARWGVLLSQIKLIFNPAARYANIAHDLKSGETYIQWSLTETKQKVYVSGSSYPTLGQVFERLSSF